MWKILKAVLTLGTCYLVGRESKLKPRDVTNGILIGLLYEKPITDPYAILDIVRREMIKAGLSKRQQEEQAAYALARIRAQM